MSEKADDGDLRHEEQETVDVKKEHTRIVVSGNEAFHQAMLAEPPQPFSKANLQIYLFSVIAYCCAAMNGYDGSLINNLLQNPTFLDQFDVGNAGLGAGIVTSIYQIGGVAALPFVGPVMDGWGRKLGMGFGALVIIVGAIIQATSSERPQFMAGRFFLGFGVSFTSTAGPTYVVELNHPAYRGVVGALYNTLWFVGAILASGAARGSIGRTWRIIVWLQCLFSGLIVVFCLILPESPRWLYVHGKQDKAKEQLVKYHTLDGKNTASPWVRLQLHEYEETLELNGADKRWWDYSALFRNRASVYRLGCSIAVSALSQWLGNAVLSYFLGAVLESAGYRSAISQANITLINNCQQFLCAIFGALIVERVGRRFLLMFSFTGCTIIWIGMTVASAMFQSSYVGNDTDGNPIYSNAAASKAALAMIFLFGAVFSIGITPLQGLYIVEVLSMEQRGKGLSFGNLATNAAGLLNQFAWPVALDKIGWHVYIIFAAWDAVMTVFVYFFLPETRGRTLEELDEIFGQRNPVKASIKREALSISRDGQIVDIHEE
ncbi:Lactose permease [Escovopsis weberi]|uniref:Lactose permease n=1 Tax=Escovopsis weberi TaxID=150374 RepID=A0A0M8N129_ESCWE|nr:Lactose permease [Escovopsis weberi]